MKHCTPASFATLLLWSFFLGEVENDNDAGFKPAETGVAVRGIADRAGRLLGSLMAVDLFAIVVLTVADVVGRYFLNRPVLGASEVIEFMLAILVFGSLPLATVAEEHVVIDLVDFALTPRGKRIQQNLVHVASAALLVFIGWRLWARAAELGAHGDATQSLLLPLAPLGYGMAVMSWISALLALALVLRAVQGQPIPSPAARELPLGTN